MCNNFNTSVGVMDNLLCFKVTQLVINAVHTILELLFVITFTWCKQDFIKPHLILSIC